MTIIKFPSRKNEPAFLNDIKEDGYHVYSLNNAKIHGYYPREFSKYPEVNLETLKNDDTVTIRVFFGIGTGENIQADGDYLDLKIEHIDGETIFAIILTELPKEFPLQIGGSLEIYEDEILYKTEATEH